MLYDDTVILVYAKAPVAGEVNTRLIPDIGVQTATDLQYQLIQQRLSSLHAAKLCQVRLMCAPDVQHEVFLQCRQQYSVELMGQQGRDLGQRLLNGISNALERFKYCIVLGTDAPALEVSVIRQAIEVLHNNTPVVFVPAEDGGYVLLGLDRPRPFLFQGISWGSPLVMQQSRNKLVEKNIAYKELSTCWDIDRLEDYQRYLKSIHCSV